VKFLRLAFQYRECRTDMNRIKLFNDREPVLKESSLIFVRNVFKAKISFPSLPWMILRALLAQGELRKAGLPHLTTHDVLREQISE
jgi:hypothetical protein